MHEVLSTSKVGHSALGVRLTALLLPLLLLLLLATTTNAQQGADSCQFQPDASVRCESIEYHGCQALSIANSHVNTTSFPNMYGHSDQQTARHELEASRLLMLENLRCSAYTRLLVCSAFYPLCFQGLFQKVEPCQEMCVDVRESCLRPYQEATGETDWPDLLRCDRFDSHGTQLCILNETSCGTATTTPQNTPTSSTGGGAGSPTSEPACQGRLVVTNKSRSGFAGVGNCAEPCEGVYFEDDQSTLITVWSTAISFLTLVVSILIVFTFVLNYRAVRSLEAPIYYISFCYGFVGLMNLVSVAVGREAVLCDPTLQNSFNQSVLVYQGLESPVCSTLFSFSYYFTICGWSWWAVLALEWGVSSIRSEAVGRYWTVGFHVLGWGTPFVFLLIALFTGSFSGDPITQTCWVRKGREIGFLLIPLGTAILVCAGLSVTVQARVVQLQNAKLREVRNGISRNSSNNNNNNSSGSGKTADRIDPSQLLRIGIYITFCIIPMGVLFSTYFYDYWYRDVWERSYLLSCSSAGADGASSLQNCDSVPPGSKPLSQVFIAQVFVWLCMGFISVFWLLRQQLLLGWKRLCCVLCRPVLGGTGGDDRGLYHFSTSTPTPATTPSSAADMGVAAAVAMVTGGRGGGGGNPPRTNATRLESIHVLSDSPRRARQNPIQVQVGRGPRVESIQVEGHGYGVEPIQVEGRGYGVEPIQMEGRGYGVEPIQGERRDFGMGAIQMEGRGYGVEPIQVLDGDITVMEPPVGTTVVSAEVMGGSEDSDQELQEAAVEVASNNSGCSVDSESGTRHYHRTRYLEPRRTEPVRIEASNSSCSVDSESGTRHYHRTRYFEPRSTEPIRIELESGTESQV